MEKLQIGKRERSFGQRSAKVNDFIKRQMKQDEMMKNLQKNER
jgi:hypothetical protein